VLPLDLDVLGVRGRDGLSSCSFDLLVHIHEEWQCGSFLACS
jgi:hypothetical protein